MPLSKGRLLRGTLVLTAAGLLVKLMGAAYRIPLSRMLGEEGIGLYQMAYPVYLVFSSLSTAGIPIAISKLIAESVARGDLDGVRQLFRTSLWALLAMGLAGSLTMGFGAGWFAEHLAADPRAFPVVVSLAPAVGIMAVMSAFRGYFQGWQEMKPSGVSQLWEQGVRVTVLLTLAYLLLPSGVEWAASGAAFGATAGALAGVAYLVWKYSRFQRVLAKMQIAGGMAGPHVQRRWLRRLVKFAFPVALGSVLMPLMQALDSVFVPGRLQELGYSVGQATGALGQLGNAWAVLYLPLIITAALSAGLVPAVSEAVACRKPSELGARIREGYRVAAWVLPAASMGLLILGKPIYHLIYNGQLTPILVWLAPGVFFLGWQQVSAAVLQGLNRPNLPLRHFGLGCLVKAMLTWLLTGQPELGIFGAALATIAGSALTALLNLHHIYWLTGQKGWLQALAIPTAASIAMGGLGYLLLHLCPDLCRQELGTVALILLLGGFYVALLWLGGGINRSDLEHFGRFGTGFSSRGWGKCDAYGSDSTSVRDYGRPKRGEGLPLG
jgi:stage V sporulation protein B